MNFLDFADRHPVLVAVLAVLVMLVAVLLLALWALANWTMTEADARASPQLFSLTLACKKIFPVLAGLLKPLLGAFVAAVAKSLVDDHFASAPPAIGGASLRPPPLPRLDQTGGDS